MSVHIDSPMAINVTDLCCREYHLVRTAQDSKALNDRRGPMIIIAGSGMATGGRVLHHLKRRLPDHRSAVLLAGHQAVGTRGRALQEGVPTVRIHGEDVPVRAHIETVDGLSAHADQNEILRWLRGFRRAPGQTYVVHGEGPAAHALASAIDRELGWRVSVAQDSSTVSLMLAPRPAVPWCAAGLASQ